jgi:hypothetical protein
MKHAKIYFLLLVLIQCTAVFAQAPASVLSTSDVDKFISTLRPMSKELDAVGISVDPNTSTAEALMANGKVMTILKKYGWDETMWIKWSSIAMCYSKVKMDEQLAALPAEQRAQMKEMMKMAGQSLDTMLNPEDLKLVKAKLGQLDAVMQDN